MCIMDARSAVCLIQHDVVYDADDTAADPEIFIYVAPSLPGMERRNTYPFCPLGSGVIENTGPDGAFTIAALDVEANSPVKTGAFDVAVSCQSGVGIVVTGNVFVVCDTGTGVINLAYISPGDNTEE
jgi:hypothetical protein